TYTADFAIYRLVSDPRVVVGAGAGAQPVVRVLTPTGTLVTQFLAFPASMNYGVHVATADINGDGKPEVFAALGTGGPPVVRIFDGNDFHLIRQIQVRAADFRAGVNLAVADVLDGSVGPELVVCFGAGAAPVVKVYNPSTGEFLRQITVFDPRYL